MNVNKKTMLTTVTMILLIISMAVIALNTTTATAQDKQTYAYMAVTPNPVGVNQWAHVAFWLQPFPPTGMDIFHNFELTITNPAGSKEIKVMDSHVDGGNTISFKPTEVGTYTFQFSYPGEFFTSVDRDYLGSISNIAELTVQEEPISSWSEDPLPTEYWSRPISNEFRTWSAISGNWLTTAYNATYKQFESASGFNPYSTAPRSGHIMYTKELALGGLTGGELGSVGYYSGATYDVLLTPPIIMNGRLYYNLYDARTFPGFVCVDLRTGEELWTNNDGFLNAGQLWYQNTPNQHGVVPLLWDLTKTKWDVYSPFNGELLYSFDNSITRINGKGRVQPIMFTEDGTMCVYILNANNDRLIMWNSTKAIVNSGLYSVSNRAEGYKVGTYRPVHGTYDWLKGIEWNVTIPDLGVSQALQMISGNVLVYSGASFSRMDYVDVGYDLMTGQQLWTQERSYAGYGDRSGGGSEIYVVHDTGISKWVGYDVNSGQELWRSESQFAPWGGYSHAHPIIAYDTLYAGSYDGYLHAYDIADGSENWNFYTGNSGSETPYGTWPVFGGVIIADGVVFASTGEHSPNQPLYRGQKIFALDAETGENIWEMSGHMVIRAIADGYLLSYNAYDNQLYTFGKGTTDVTVSASPKVSVEGDSVLIEGFVTDESPGTKDSDRTTRFPNGVPAIADEYMSTWMEYVYMQKQKPADTIGVEVELSVFDPNNNFYEVATTTSDATGMYSAVFTPNVPGKYTVIASFAGSESYYSSSAQTAINVEEAPLPEPTPTTTPAPMTDTYLTGSTIAILAGIAIAVFLLLRKK